MTQTGAVPSVEEVADRLAINAVVAMHSRGVDRASTEILKSCYWEDAEVDYGGYKGLAHAFCETLPEAIKRYTNTQHQLGNTLAEITGDSAIVETYVTAYHYLSGEQESDTEMTYIGRYIDRMQKRDGVWKIAFRQVVMTWHQNALATADEERNPSLQALSRAGRYPDDPLFKF
jgi:hypothetical protein